MLTRTELIETVGAARDRGDDLASANAAFNRLVAAFQDYAVGAAYAYLGDAGEAQDAAQEAFLVAWRTLPKLRDAALFPAWFKRIVATQSNRIWRARKLLSGDPGHPDSPPSRDFEELLSQRETKRLVADALDALTAPERLVVCLFYFAGEDQASIAKFLGVPRTTVSKRLFAAKRKLATVLRPFAAKLAQNRPSRSATFAALVRTGIYDDYVGLYRFDDRPELTVRLQRAGNRLTSVSHGQRNTVLLGARISQLRVAEFDGAGQFFRDRTGKITRFVYYEFGKKMGIARKVKP